MIASPDMLTKTKMASLVVEMRRILDNHKAITPTTPEECLEGGKMLLKMVGNIGELYELNHSLLVGDEEKGKGE